MTIFGFLAAFRPFILKFFFFFNDTATTEIYTLSLHDALPIAAAMAPGMTAQEAFEAALARPDGRSEEHTSELQSRENLVCRLLLEKKKKKRKKIFRKYKKKNIKIIK